ncbi:MlaD family protein [Mycobacteroides sp. LB1]|uniref:MlaD family protein n=1 Tax=Mycobacteroides sp. LB1 TaxID=2750814 RepID=UPI0015DD7369|nr:MCE family protein [Mycobacteroides sp. LB1]
MTTSLFEPLARGVLTMVQAGMRRRSLTSAIAVALILALGLWYLMFGALRVNPAASTIAVRIHLAESGGLLPNQDVTLRGAPIGRIESIAADGSGVTAVARIDSSVQIPESSTVEVSGLSPAGEQYVNFRADGRSGPYLVAGSVVDQQRTSVPVSLAQMLADSDGLLAQIDPVKLRAITRELGVSPTAPEKLSAILGGATFLLSTLDAVLPETVSVLKNSRLILTTLSDVNPGLSETSRNLRPLLHGIAAMDGGYRSMLANGPDTLAKLDALFADNSDTMVQLLGNLAVIAPLSYVRVPALNQFLRPDRVSMVDALGAAVHDGGLWAIADIYPRYSCDYSTPREPPSAADYPEPYANTSYCSNPDPAVLVRGARNAPRPAGDDTANPPPNADPLQRTDPTPKGRFSIPTPYGGPTLPIDPPPPPEPVSPPRSGN